MVDTIVAMPSYTLDTDSASVENSAEHPRWTTPWGVPWSPANAAAFNPTADCVDPAFGHNSKSKAVVRHVDSECVVHVYVDERAITAGAKDHILFGRQQLLAAHKALMEALGPLLLGAGVSLAGIAAHPKPLALRSALCVNLANVRLQQGEFDLAEHSLQKALRLEPTSKDALRTLIYLKLRQGDSQKALQMLQERGSFT